jgi:hypothetical protein
VVSGSLQESSLTKTYQLTVISKTGVSNAVKITKDKTTNILTVNNVQVIEKKSAATVITTTVKSNQYGNIETVTNNRTEIAQSSHTQHAIKNILY